MLNFISLFYFAVKNFSFDDVDQLCNSHEILSFIEVHNIQLMYLYFYFRMREYGVKSTDRLICFGQLLGMCDQISFSLGMQLNHHFTFISLAHMDHKSGSYQISNMSP